MPAMIFEFWAKKAAQVVHMHTGVHMGAGACQVVSRLWPPRVPPLRPNCHTLGHGHNTIRFEHVDLHIAMIGQTKRFQT